MLSLADAVIQINRGRQNSGVAHFVERVGDAVVVQVIDEVFFGLADGFSVMFYGYIEIKCIMIF